MNENPVGFVVAPDDLGFSTQARHLGRALIGTRVPARFRTGFSAGHPGYGTWVTSVR